MKQVGKKDVSIPVVKSNKDICRLIFQSQENGKFDIKIDFLKNEYKVQLYRLFAERPIIWDVDNSENVNISYHHGAAPWPVLIHLKRYPAAEGQDVYTTLCEHRLQPPNTNQKFPIPLLKLEIPQGIIDHAKDYKRKKYHHVLDILNSNVLEIYMASKEFSFEDYSTKYGCVMGIQTMMSIDFFASNTVLSDYQKMGNMIPHGKVEPRMRWITNIEGMQLFAIMYPDPNVDKLKKIAITFIENEFAEDVLLWSRIFYPDNRLTRGQSSFTIMSGANTEEFKRFRAPFLNPSLNPHSVASKILKQNNLSKKEKEELRTLAIQSGFRLQHQYKLFEKKVEKEKTVLQAKCIWFNAIIAIIKNQINLTKGKYLGKEGYEFQDWELWFLTEEYMHPEDIHILLAKYLGLSSCRLAKKVIYSTRYKEETFKGNIELDSNGHKVAYIRHKTNTKFEHVWLLYDDIFDIDIRRGSLNVFLCEKDATEPDILISRGKNLYMEDIGWDGMEEKLRRNNFICDTSGMEERDSEQFRLCFEEHKGLLQRIYEMIEDVSEKIKLKAEQENMGINDP